MQLTDDKCVYWMITTMTGNKELHDKQLNILPYGEHVHFLMTNISISDRMNYSSDA